MGGEGQILDHLGILGVGLALACNGGSCNIVKESCHLH